MKAVVMAGGEGSRLRPLTLGRPKPMIPLVNKNVLSHILDLLKQHGITDVVMTLQYMANRIQDYYGDGSQFGMNIEYAIENVPLGTAGSVKNAAALLEDTFLVISGDALTNFNLSHIINTHRASDALATMTLTRVPHPLDYGMVKIDDSGRIRQLIEKPGWSEVVSDTVNTGIYVLEPEVLQRIPPDEPCDFSYDLFRELIDEQAPFYGVVAEGYWTDIGRLEEYRRASDDMLNGVARIEPLGTEIRPGVWADGEVDIAPDAILRGPIYLGPGVQIKGGVTIQGPTVIRDNVVVDNRAMIERAIIWRNCYIGERVEVRGALIGLQCSIKARAMIFEGAVVSDNTLIRENALIQPGVKIWPDKEIEAGATVTTSIVYGNQGKRNLFGRYGLTGLVNVELTPEFCAKVGAAYGGTLRKGANVAVNREAHNTPRVLKRAILSGLPSAGINVLDLATLPVPVFRFYTRASGAKGGVHTRLSPYDNRVVDIIFVGEDGLDLSQRAQRTIENVFFREDIRRVFLEEIGIITYPGDVGKEYQEAFLNGLERERWPLERQGDRRYDHLVIDYANSTTVLTLPDILNVLKCDIVAVNTLLDQNLLFRARPEWDSDMQRLAKITNALGANFGVRLDVGGERIFFTSNDGSVMEGMDTLIAMATLTFMAYPGALVGVPLTAPHLIEQIAAQYGGQVHRLRLSQNLLMQAGTDQTYIMIGDDDGGFIFPHFTPFMDGMFAVVKMMEMTSKVGQSFSQVWRDRLPYCIEQSKVGVRWEQKGKVMRLLHERFNAPENQAAEGIQIPLGDEWVIIIPDVDEPLFIIHAEAGDSVAAQALVEKYGALVNNLAL